MYLIILLKPLDELKHDSLLWGKIASKHIPYMYIHIAMRIVITTQNVIRQYNYIFSVITFRVGINAKCNNNIAYLYIDYILQINVSCSNKNKSHQ